MINNFIVYKPVFFNDKRGFNCAYELNFNVRQSLTSVNTKLGTLRGIHFQISPFSQNKLITCIKGSIFDVVIDFRKNSSTYMNHIEILLTDKDKKILYVPMGCAHGYQTLEDNTEVQYQLDSPYHKQSESGIMYDDPAFNIQWPIDEKILSDKDTKWNYLHRDMM